MPSKISTIIISIICILTSAFAYAQAEEAEFITKPKEIYYHNKDIKLDKEWHIICDADDESIYAIAVNLQDYLKGEFQLHLKIMPLTKSRLNKAIVLLNLSKASSRKYTANIDMSATADLISEGYLINSKRDEVMVVANDYAGLFYGIQTIKDLVKNRNDSVIIESVSIKDWPKSKIRGVHLLAADYRQSAYKQLETLARHKYNLVIFENQHIYDINNRQVKESFKKLFDYARNLYIKPAIDIGISAPVLAKEPYAAAGVYIEEEPFIFRQNKAVALKPKYIYIENSDFESITTSFSVDNWVLGDDWSLDTYNSYKKGSYSVTVDTGSRKGSGRLQYADSIEVEPNTWYGLRFYAKTSFNEGPFAPAVRVFEYDRWGLPVTRSLYPIQHIFELNKPNRKFWQNDWRKAELVFKTHSRCDRIAIYADVYKSAGKAWFDDFRLMRLNATLANVIKSDVIDIQISSSDKKEIYREGVDYAFEEGKISFLGEDYCYYDFESEPSSIRRLPGGGISENEKVLISYNAAFGVTTGSISGQPYCISEPLSYRGNNNGSWQGIYRLIDEIILELEPVLIHYSHVSEMKGLNRDGRDLKRKVNNYELVAEDINKVYNYIAMSGHDTPLSVWDDMLNPWHNGGNINYQVPYGGAAGATSQAIELIPDDILIVIWWYDLEDTLSKMQYSPDYFETKGFKYLVAGYNNLQNIKDWSRLIRNKKACQGIIITTWEGFEANQSVIVKAAEYLW